MKHGTYNGHANLMCKNYDKKCIAFQKSEHYNTQNGHKMLPECCKQHLFQMEGMGWGGGGLLSLQFPLPTLSGISGSIPVKELEYGINDLPMSSFV